MNDRERLHEFLATDPSDVGCDRALAMLHVVVDLVASGGVAEDEFPGIAAHLRACGPCNADFEGLLAAATERD